MAFQPGLWSSLGLPLPAITPFSVGSPKPRWASCTLPSAQPAQAAPGASSLGPSSRPTTLQLHFHRLLHDRLLHDPWTLWIPLPPLTHMHTRALSVWFMPAYHFRRSLCTPTSMGPRKPPTGALGTLSSPDRFLDLAPSQNSDLSRGSMTITTPSLPSPRLGAGTERCSGSNSEIKGWLHQRPKVRCSRPVSIPSAKVTLKIMHSVALHPELGIYIWMSVNNKLKYTESSNQNRF